MLRYWMELESSCWSCMLNASRTSLTNFNFISFLVFITKRCFVIKLNKNDAFCIITFFREEYNVRINRLRNRALKERLRLMKYVYHPIIGKWEGEKEESFVVVSNNSDNKFIKDMINLGRFDKKTPQDSILLKLRNSNWIRLIDVKTGKYEHYVRWNTGNKSYLENKINKYKPI